MNMAQYQQGHLYIMLMSPTLVTISYHVGADEERLMKQGDQQCSVTTS